MNQKSNALERVKTSMELYLETQKQLARDRQGLFESVRAAREVNATQQQIADATDIGGQGLSRQRIAQIIQEGS